MDFSLGQSRPRVDEFPTPVHPGFSAFAGSQSARVRVIPNEEASRDSLLQALGRFQVECGVEGRIVNGDAGTPDVILEVEHHPFSDK